MAALITRRAALSSAGPGYLDALERNRGCASAYLRSRALTLAMAGFDQPVALGVGEHGQPELPDFTASWSLWSPCWTCYFAPKICSSLPAAMRSAMPMQEV